jgi:P pilus assembly chaperone PapD
MFKNIIICVIIYLILSQTVAAIAVGVTPGNLYFDSQVGIPDTKSLFVINTGTEVTNYEVYVDEDYSEWFDISPVNFNLNASENKEVKLKLNPPISTKGEFEFKAYIVASSPSSDFSVGSGIKVPVYATVSNSGITLVIILALTAGTGIFLRIRKNKSTK